MWKTLAAALSLVAVLASPARAEPPKVVVSIQPLHSLVSGVMAGVGEPGLIVSGAQSEHTYALKPSDARALERAGLVVLVDEHFESFLAKPLKRRGDKAATLAMAELPGIRRLPLREGGVWEKHRHDARPAHDHDHEDDHDFDGHLWLDPANAALLVGAVADQLAELDPANADRYRANATDMQARLQALDAELAARLSGLAGRPYVVFHDAYQYFESRYGLSPAGAITVDPERPVSARRLAELRDRLTSSGAACIFREPQFPAPVVDRLAKSAGARTGVLDPQGAALPPGSGQYFLLMTGLADSLTECLSGR